MACSDNVIRGGLTPKYVDIVELLKIVDCREVTLKLSQPHLKISQNLLIKRQ